MPVDGWQHQISVIGDPPLIVLASDHGGLATTFIPGYPSGVLPEVHRREAKEADGSVVACVWWKRCVNGCCDCCVLRGRVHGFDVRAHTADFSCGEPTDDAADAIRASNTAEFAEFGTGDYRDDHSMEASTSDVLVRRRREGLQESRAAKQ